MIRILKRAFVSTGNRATVILKGSQPNGIMRIEKGAKILENAADINQSSPIYLHYKSNTMIAAVEVSYNSPSVISLLINQINISQPGRLEALLYSKEKLPETPTLRDFHSKCFKELLNENEFMQVLPLDNGRQFIPIDCPMDLMHLRVTMKDPENINKDSLFNCTNEIAAAKSIRFVLIENARTGAEVTDKSGMIAQIFAQSKYELGNKALGLVTSNVLSLFSLLGGVCL